MNSARSGLVTVTEGTIITYFLFFLPFAAFLSAGTLAAHTRMCAPCECVCDTFRIFMCNLFPLRRVLVSRLGPTSRRVCNVHARSKVRSKCAALIIFINVRLIAYNASTNHNNSSKRHSINMWLIESKTVGSPINT